MALNSNQLVLELLDIHAGYGGIKALRGVNLWARQDEIVAIVGSNGAGKSTLLKMISGLVKPTSGSIKYFSQEIKHLRCDLITRLGVTLVPEGRGILAAMTVEENLLMGSYCRTDKVEIKGDLERVMVRFPILEKRKGQLAGTLSGGEQQLLAIGRALMSKSKLLMLDEPSLGLAPLMVAEIFRIVKELKQERVAILLAEQNASKALQCADRGYVLETGRAVLEGETGNLLNNPTVQKVYLGR